MMEHLFKMFLIAVEEKSITQAAERANITQQCLSSHILKLEKLYGIRLFFRKPFLTLTPAGEKMLETLRNVEILEKDLFEKIKEIKEENKGTIKFGISPIRAQILLPNTIDQFNTFFPQVEIVCFTETTAACEEMLQKGTIDFFLGVNPSFNVNFNYESIFEEPLFLIANNLLLESHVKQDLYRSQNNSAQGVNLAEFLNVPFIQNLKNSSLRQIIQNHCDNLRIKLFSPFTVSSFTPQIAICGKGVAAAFCPSGLLTSVYEYNQIQQNPDNKIKIFKINGLSEHLKINIVSLKGSYQPLYLKKFINILSNTIRHINKTFSLQSSPLQERDN